VKGGIGTATMLDWAVAVVPRRFVVNSYKCCNRAALRRPDARSSLLRHCTSLWILWSCAISNAGIYNTALWKTPRPLRNSPAQSLYSWKFLDYTANCWRKARACHFDINEKFRPFEPPALLQPYKTRQSARFSIHEHIFNFCALYKSVVKK